MASEKRKKEQLYNLVYCKRAHFILVFLNVDTGTWGEAAARLQIQFHNMQFHTQFAVTKRPRTHETLAWLTPDWPEGGHTPPGELPGLSGASPTAAEQGWRAKNRHLLSQKCSFSLPFRSTFCQRPAFAATGFTNVNLSCQAPVERLFFPPDPS